MIKTYREYLRVQKRYSVLKDEACEPSRMRFAPDPEIERLRALLEDYHERINGWTER
jgi:hypothetical protein